MRIGQRSDCAFLPSMRNGFEQPGRASSSAPPFNIEFSGRPITKKLEKEIRRILRSPNRLMKPGPGRGRACDRTSDASARGEGGDHDPKAISESLRRIRASGPLIIAAIKQNTDRQSIDRINEIIAQSIQGMTEDKAAVESPAESSVGSGSAAAAPPPRINGRAKSESTGKSCAKQMQVFR